MRGNFEIGENNFVELNCLGDVCPVPIMKLIEYENELSEGIKIMLVTDHSCTAESVKNYCHSCKLKLEVVEPINGVWEMYIYK
ncbi:MAG TPA: sulfurtransferase TusA family protein [Anaerovoracaceae bacterium]|nr:sulfurtransferase TusA family protein [Anaerovoracaceae bacterium]